MPLDRPKPDEEDKELAGFRSNKGSSKPMKASKNSFEDGYDSPLTESMPNPSSELCSEIMSDASSWIQDEEEGIARKPNIFRNFNKLTTSEKKTANDSDNNSQNNFKNNNHYEHNYNGAGNNSLEINSSWEVIEGSSIIMEVESSFKSESISSKRNDVPKKEITRNIGQVDPSASKKSSESLTATFASRAGSRNQQKEESKKLLKKKNKAKEGPFHYGPNSDEDDFDSEQEEFSYQSHQSDNNTKATPGKSHLSAKQTLTNKIQPVTSHQNSAHHSEQERSEENDWIGGGDEKKVPKSVNGQKERRVPDSPSSSQQIESMSTRTSPHLQYHPKLLKKQQTKVDKYVNQQDFKNFIQNSKRQIISEKNSLDNGRKQWKSPLRIVDKLVDDAQKRLKNKKQNEPLGRDTPFASLFNKWTSTLRNNSQQPEVRNKYNTHSSLRSNDSRVNGSVK